MESIQKNNTWKLTMFLTSKNPITSKWVFKVKRTTSEEVDKLKIPLVARGLQQCRGLEFDETFAPTNKWPTIHTMVVISTKNQWTIKHLDVKTIFLNGVIEEKVFMY